MWAAQVWEDPNSFIDLWLMDKFSVLPTDDRFLNLYEEQKLAIFQGICNLPDYDKVKKEVIIQNALEKIKSRELETFANKNLIRQMEREFESEGLDRKQVKERIKEQLKRFKDVEIKNLERIRNGK